jgi:hypothetical protein
MSHVHQSIAICLYEHNISINKASFIEKNEHNISVEMPTILMPYTRGFKRLIEMARACVGYAITNYKWRRGVVFFSTEEAPSVGW